MKPGARFLSATCLSLFLVRSALPAQEVPDLFMAIYEGDTARVQAMLDAGADPNMTVEGRTPLMFAVWGQHPALVRLLVAKGANLKMQSTPAIPLINVAAEVENVELLEYLLENGADINARGTSIRAEFDRKPNLERPPLMIAIQHHAPARGPSAAVDFLLKRGADVDARDALGWTALMLAAKRGDLASVNALIQGGADVNLKSNDGRTALDRARELVQDPPVVVQALLAAGAAEG